MTITILERQRALLPFLEVQCWNDISMSNMDLDVSTLPRGFYILTATTDSGEAYVGKFCKE
jgi:hypothetical protein